MSFAHFNDQALRGNTTLDNIGGFFNSVAGFFNNASQNATSVENHGMFSGNWNDFQLGTERIVGLIPHATSLAGQDYLTNVGVGAGNFASSLLIPLSSNYSFYFLAVGGILGLLIVGYILMKV